jgi:hypothetical protein
MECRLLRGVVRINVTLRASVIGGRFLGTTSLTVSHTDNTFDYISVFRHSAVHCVLGGYRLDICAS